MSKKINIDDLLKQEMEHLSPEPPADMWQSISNQLPDVVTTSSTSTTGAAKTVFGVSLKSVVIAAAIATGAIGYVIYTSSNNNPSNTSEATNGIIGETLPEVKTVDENPTSEGVTSLNQTNVLPKTISSPKNKKHQNKITTFDDLPDDEVQVDMPAPTSTQSNKDLVNNEEIVSVKQEQQNVQTNTEKSLQENKQASNYSTTQSTSSEEFLKPNIPNVFTPNNDGYNDEFVITIENELLYDLKITDAKGNVVFESRDKNKHWNGTNQRNGETCEPGVYVLAFSYQFKGMSEPKIEKGLILLKL
jgi:gliding motility-associated-like protein